MQVYISCVNTGKVLTKATQYAFTASKIVHTKLAAAHVAVTAIDDSIHCI